MAVYCTARQPPENESAVNLTRLCILFDYVYSFLSSVA